jgi:AraC-like DNA-binding protein
MTFTVADVSPEHLFPLYGDVPGSASLSANTPGRPHICSVAWPRLKIAAQTRHFHFFEPTLLLILAGTLEFGDGKVLTPWSHAGLIDQHVQTDFCKTPQSETAPFRSLFLTFDPALVVRFNQHCPDAPAAGSGKTAIIPNNPVLLNALQTLLVSLNDRHLSDERVVLRVFDLLMVLKEQGFQFSPGSSPLISRRLMTLLNAEPEQSWTAERAAQRLAMSGSTLRRRLKTEETSFEQLLLETRMHHALMLVQTTQWNLVQIADACGYKSVARFSERFKERFGSTPGRFR